MKLLMLVLNKNNQDTANTANNGDFCEEFKWKSGVDNIKNEDRENPRR